jgi:uncharacterized membrane protein
MLAAYPLEALVLGALALTAGGPIHFGAVFWGCLYGVGQAFGMWAFYAALGSGPISVVAPLAGVLNAAVPVAVGIALGERPGQAARWGRRTGHRRGDAGQPRGHGRGCPV